MARCVPCVVAARDAVASAPVSSFQLWHKFNSLDYASERKQSSCTAVSLPGSVDQCGTQPHSLLLLSRLGFRRNMHTVSRGSSPA